MSIQAVAWVLSQPPEDLPVIPRAIMFALANHADHTDGHCWPAIETIAKEAGVGERTVSRYLAALARNGFIDKRQKNAKGQFRSNDYWILFDRKPAKWSFFEAKDEGTEEPHATEADGSEAPDCETRTPLEADGRTPLEADAYKERTVRSEPSDPEQVDSTRATTPVAAEPPPPEPTKPPPPQPSRFDPQARQREQQRLKAADEARKPKRYPVIRGTPAWNAWVAHGHSDSLHATIVMPDGRRDRGWMFPTLWPPRKAEATGPPEAAE